MTFDERMSQIRSELTEMLATYAIPKHLDTENKVRQEIEGLARMVNHKMPNDTTSDHIRGTFERASMKLKSAHTSRTWPTGKDIDAAVTKSMTTSLSSLPANMARELVSQRKERSIRPGNVPLGILLPDKKGRILADGMKRLVFLLHCLDRCVMQGWLGGGTWLDRQAHHASPAFNLEAQVIFFCHVVSGLRRGVIGRGQPREMSA